MNIDWGLVLTIAGTVLTTGALVYAVKTNREKEKREQIVKQALIGIGGNIYEARRSTSWADNHFRSIREASGLQDIQVAIPDIQRHAHDGARDAVAAERMLGNLLGQVVTLQAGLFGSRTLYHPNHPQLTANDVKTVSSPDAQREPT